MKKGFTLIEIVVAIFLLTVGTMGAFSLIQQTIAFTSIASAQLAATYLAQEGIETIRNIRDSNFLANSTWDNGLASSDWQVVNFLDGSQSKFQRKKRMSISKSYYKRQMLSPLRKIVFC